jgi:hypothetical protein
MWEAYAISSGSLNIRAAQISEDTMQTHTDIHSQLSGSQRRNEEPQFKEQEPMMAYAISIIVITALIAALIGFASIYYSKPNNNTAAATGMSTGTDNTMSMTSQTGGNGNATGSSNAGSNPPSPNTPNSDITNGSNGNPPATANPPQ